MENKEDGQDGHRLSVLTTMLRGAVLARWAGEMVGHAATSEALRALVDALADGGADRIIEEVEPVERVCVSVAT